MPASDGKKEHGKFMIQVVSFQERAKADGVLKQLSTMGYKARVVEVNVPHKGRWFRVIMTGYNNRDDAQQVSDRIAKSVKGVNCVVLSD
jgi:cell division protein FtsN